MACLPGCTSRKFSGFNEHYQISLDLFIWPLPFNSKTKQHEGPRRHKRNYLLKWWKRSFIWLFRDWDKKFEESTSNIEENALNIEENTSNTSVLGGSWK